MAVPSSKQSDHAEVDQMKPFKLVAVLVASFLLFAGCGSSDDSDTSQGDGSDKQSQTDGPSDDEQSDSGGSPSGGGSGTLTLAGSEIELTGVRCFLQPQDAAAGGGKILFTGQGTGETADGEAVMLDISRYDQDSQFAGDDISVAIGEIASADVYASTRADSSDVITQEDSSISASDVELQHQDGGEAKTVSFELSC